MFTQKTPIELVTYSAERPHFKEYLFELLLDQMNATARIVQVTGSEHTLSLFLDHDSNQIPFVSLELHHEDGALVNRQIFPVFCIMEAIATYLTRLEISSFKLIADACLEYYLRSEDTEENRNLIRIGTEAYLQENYEFGRCLVQYPQNEETWNTVVLDGIKGKVHTEGQEYFIIEYPNLLYFNTLVKPDLEGKVLWEIIDNEFADVMDQAVAESEAASKD